MVILDIGLHKVSNVVGVPNRRGKHKTIVAHLATAITLHQAKVPESAFS